MKFTTKPCNNYYINSLILSSFLCFVCFWGIAQKRPKIVRTKVHHNISIVVPQGFQAMDAAAVQGTFLSYRAPIAAFQYGTSPVYITINDSESRMFFDSDMAVMQKIYKSTIQNMYQTTQFLQEDTTLISGRSAIRFEFLGKFIQENPLQTGMENAKLIYNYMSYVRFGSRVFIFGFSAPAFQQDKWKPIAEEFMQNILIVDTKKKKKKKK